MEGERFLQLPINVARLSLRFGGYIIERLVDVRGAQYNAALASYENKHQPYEVDLTFTHVDNTVDEASITAAEPPMRESTTVNSSAGMTRVTVNLHQYEIALQEKKQESQKTTG